MVGNGQTWLMMVSQTMIGDGEWPLLRDDKSKSNRLVDNGISGDSHQEGYCFLSTGVLTQ